MPGAANCVKNLYLWEMGSKQAAGAALYDHAKKAEGYAKNNAPWSDDTGETRGSITGSLQKGPLVLQAVIAHQTMKGRWLEDPYYRVRSYGNPNCPIWGTRFRILEDAIMFELPSLWSKLQAIFGGRVPGVFSRFTGTSYGPSGPMGI